MNKNDIKKLSFPDSEVEKMEFNSKRKLLKIYVSSACLNEKNGKVLGKGILFFSEWQSLTVQLFDSITEKWSIMEDSQPDELKDLCEVNFKSPKILLSGFGKKSGQWIKWEILNPKMKAEF